MSLPIHWYETDLTSRVMDDPSNGYDGLLCLHCRNDRGARGVPGLRYARIWQRIGHSCSLQIVVYQVIPEPGPGALFVIAATLTFVARRPQLDVVPLR